MKQFKGMISAVLGLGLLMSQPANATLINFDEPNAHDNLISSFDLGNGTVVRYSELSDQYQNLGVTFSGDWMVVENDATFGEQPISGNGFAAFNSTQNNILSINFDNAIDSVSGYIGGGLVDCCYENMDWSVVAYLAGNEVGRDSYTSIASPLGGGFTLFDLTFQQADRVEITAMPSIATSLNFSGVLEDLSFSRAVAVDSPSSFALIILSLLLLSRRQMKSI